MGMVPSGGEVQLQHCTEEHFHLSFRQCGGSSEAQTTKDANRLHRILTLLEPLAWQLSQTHILPGVFLNHLKTRGHDAGDSPKAQRKEKSEREPRMCLLVLSLTPQTACHHQT